MENTKERLESIKLDGGAIPVSLVELKSMAAELLELRKSAASEWLDYPENKPSEAITYLVEFYAGHHGIIKNSTLNGTFSFMDSDWYKVKRFAEIRP